MIIDAHTHVGRRHLPAARLADGLLLAGIDRAVIFADPESPVLAAENEYVLAEARERDWIPFWYIGGNAYSGSRPAGPIGLPDNPSDYAGVKWHCYFTPEHDGGWSGLVTPREAESFLRQSDVIAAMRMFERCGMPVVFEEAYEITIRAVPAFPGVTFIIPHLGMLNGGSGPVLDAVGEAPNVFFDTSIAHPSRALVDGLGHGKLLFGSDYPYGSPAAARRAIESLNLPADQASAILGGNLLEILPPPWGKECTAG